MKPDLSPTIDKQLLTSSTPIRILLADDHPVILSGLNQYLSGRPEFTVVGTASHALQAEALSLQHRPDIILLDLDLPPQPGYQTVVNIHTQAPEVKIVILSQYRGAPYLPLILAHIAGYIHKSETPETIAHALDAVMQGERWFSQNVSRAFIEFQQQRTTRQSLTPREREVLQLLVKNFSNRQIAQTLSISQRTVEQHLTQIYQKLGVKGRLAAAVVAVQKGWVLVD